MFKMDLRSSGNYYRVAKRFKTYLYNTGIIMQSVKQIGDVTCLINDKSCRTDNRLALNLEKPRF